MKKQNGFTLIKVLLLSTMAAVVVFGAMRETLVQERLSGNFQKSMNARFLSEKGIYIVAKCLKDKLIEDPSLTRDQLVMSQCSYSGGGSAGDDLKFDAFASAGDEPDIVVITSSGERYSGDSNDKLTAHYKFTPGNSASVNDSFMAGCTGVSLKGSSLIDSYDSSVGSYEQTKSSNAVINTSSSNADVVLSGHSIIKGDVNASGAINLMGSSPVYGNIKSNTGITISSGGGVRVDGNAQTLGDILHQGGEITGYVRANGSATMKSGASIANLGNDDFDIQYGGTGTFPKNESGFSQNGIHYSNSRFNVNPQLTPIEIHAPDSPQCDPLALTQNMDDVIGDSDSYPYYEVRANQHYTFAPTWAYYETVNGNSNNNGNGNGNGNGNSGNDDLSAISALQKDIYIFDTLKQQSEGVAQSDSDLEYVYGMTGFTVGSNGSVTIQGGDVIFLIDGDFSIQGGSGMTIKAGSSLSIFVTGNIDLGGSGNVYVEQHGLTTSGHAAFNIYSSQSGEGVSLGGNSDMYAKVYAPLSTVSVTGSGSLYGSIIGAFIYGSGSGDYHFDEALKTIDLGVGNEDGSIQTKPTLTFERWYYRLPNSSE
ncbi:DUF7305 domain-containing protein [Pseudoalteromonas byunsanensis]|uniref:DUF7305 domain-containing protein n=1 Tax=Pseudoalteromonas byunsanensis TaxID=327939 RepID=A0A1S1N9C8_9GAMM|nr:hypothetical protein [Pseudoalteromonas byunsanensis]OHU96268.1 hypothetical protein BIW53_06905 [Pseudoalteromonas byunsanensis]